MNRNKRVEMFRAMQVILANINRNDSLADIETVITEEMERLPYPKEILDLGIQDDEIPLDDTSFSYMMEFFLEILHLARHQHDVLECDGVFPMR